MANWFRVPAFLGGRLHGDHVATEHEAWTDLLGRWHMGEDVSACAFAEATKWGKGRVLKFMAKVAEWANEAGATVPRRWQADRNADQDRTVMRTVATEVQPTQTDDDGPETDRTPDRNRTASRARLPLERDRDVDVDQTVAPDRADAIQRPVPVRLDAPTVTDAPAAAPTATPLVLSDAWVKHLPTDTTTTDAPAATPDPIADAWAALVAWTPKPAAWKLTGPRRTRLRALAKEHGAPALLTVAAWMTSTHERAKFLRDRGDPDTLLRNANFATYLALAESTSPAANRPTVAPGPIDTNPFRRTKP